MGFTHDNHEHTRFTCIHEQYAIEETNTVLHERKKFQFGLMSLCIPVNVLRAFTNVYAILAHVKLDCSDIAHAHCAMSN